MKKRSVAEPVTEPEVKQAAWKKRLRALGFAGFMFFLLKGIGWLVVGYFFTQGCN